MKRKCKNKKIVIALSIVVTIAVSVLFFIFVVSKGIVIDSCASPCRHDHDSTTCITLCDTITLYDIITGRDEWPTQ